MAACLAAGRVWDVAAESGGEIGSDIEGVILPHPALHTEVGAANVEAVRGGGAYLRRDAGSARGREGPVVGLDAAAQRDRVLFVRRLPGEPVVELTLEAALRL